MRVRPDRAVVKKAIDDAKGNLSRAAVLLGCSRPTLYTWIYQLGLERHAGICIDSRVGFYRRDRKDTRPNNPQKQINQVLNPRPATPPILRVVPPTATEDLPIQAGVKLPESLWKRVKIEAIREGCTVSEFVHRALEATLTERATGPRRKRADTNGKDTE